MHLLRLLRPLACVTGATASRLNSLKYAVDVEYVVYKRAYLCTHGHGAVNRVSRLSVFVASQNGVLLDGLT